MLDFLANYRPREALATPHHSKPLSQSQAQVLRWPAVNWASGHKLSCFAWEILQKPGWLWVSPPVSMRLLMLDVEKALQPPSSLESFCMVGMSLSEGTKTISVSVPTKACVDGSFPLGLGFVAVSLATSAAWPSKICLIDCWAGYTKKVKFNIVNLST